MAIDLESGDLGKVNILDTMMNMMKGSAWRVWED